MLKKIIFRRIRGHLVPMTITGASISVVGTAIGEITASKIKKIEYKQACNRAQMSALND